MGSKNKPGKFDCLHKIKDDEPFFVTRAQDWTAPYSVLNWIKNNFEFCSEEKLREAFDCALNMRKFPGRRSAN